MSDLQRTLLIAGSCAAAAGAIGLAALRLRGRSLRAKVITALAPISLSTAAGFLCAVRAGLVSGHDCAPMVEVCIAAAPVVLAMAVLLTRRASTDLGILCAAMRAMGEGTLDEHDDQATLPRHYSDRKRSRQPVRLATAELDDLGRELVAAEARLSRSREREHAEERYSRELLAKATLDLHAPLANLHALAMALEDDAATEPVACYARTLEMVDRLTRMVDDLFELCVEPGSHRDPGRPERRRGAS